MATPRPFGPRSQKLLCPFCEHQVTTRVECEASTQTHLLATILSVFGCVPFCLLPYCIDSYQHKNHYCPYCEYYLETYAN